MTDKVIFHGETVKVSSRDKGRLGTLSNQGVLWQFQPTAGEVVNLDCDLMGAILDEIEKRNQLELLKKVEENGK